MIFQYGVIFVVALFSTLPNSDLPTYQYKAEVSSPNVCTDLYLYAESDDDEYWFTFNVGLTFDLYYNDGTTVYYTNNYRYNVDIYRHYMNSNNASGTYNISGTSSEEWLGYELETYVSKLSFNMYHEDDTCHFEVFNNSNNARFLNVTNSVLPVSEEFIFDYGFEILLDYSKVSQACADFISLSKSYAGGYSDGYSEGVTIGYNDGYNTGYQGGYIDGYTEGASQDEVAVAIFSGIISVGLIPINFFLACLNFEVFGINIGAFVSALLTIAIVVIITRMIISGGNGGDK